MIGDRVHCGRAYNRALLLPAQKQNHRKRPLQVQNDPLLQHMLVDKRHTVRTAQNSVHHGAIRSESELLFVVVQQRVRKVLHHIQVCGRVRVSLLVNHDIQHTAAQVPQELVRKVQDTARLSEKQRHDPERAELRQRALRSGGEAKRYTQVQVSNAELRQC